MKSKGLYRDFFLHFDIFIMICLFVGIASYIAIQESILTILLFFLGGLVTFMFSEYLTHRFLFHLKAPKNIFF